MIKRSIQEEDIKLVNIYATYIAAPKYTKQILRDTKEETDNNTIIVGDFDVSGMLKDRSSRQIISKATEVLNDTIDQLDLTDVY